MPVTSTNPWTPEQKERARRNVEFVNANLKTFTAMAQQPPETFGEKLCKAVKARITVTATAPSPSYYPPSEESFAAKLSKAVKARAGTMPTQKQHEEQAERERNRYRKPVRRERTKGE